MGRILTLVVGALLLALAGCGGTGSTKRAADSTASVVLPSQAAAGGIQSGGTSGQVGTAASSSTGASPSGTTTGSRFQVAARSTSDRIKSVELLLRGAERTSDGLALEISFVNVTDELINITGSISGRDATLTGADAVEQKPKDVSASLRAGIEPESQGFVPGSASAGTITFPRQTGTGPFTLKLPSYQPITFSLNAPQTVQSDRAIPTGDFSVTTGVRGTRDALSRIEMRINKVSVQSSGVDVDLSFVNTTRQGYSLISGPQGKDARLLNGSRLPTAPTLVPDAFKDSIAPKDGWQPGGDNRATLRFPAPKPGPERALRFVFPAFDTIVLSFTERGLSGVQVTSPSGGSPRPAATPAPEDAVVTAIDTLLARHADALKNNDEGAYLALVEPTYSAAARATYRRISSLPLKGITLKLAPEARFPDVTKPALERIAVEVAVSFTGIPDDNAFLYTLSYTFARSGSAWRVANVEAERNPPFWLTGEVVVHESPHFLIIARPDAATDLPAFAAEAEHAYTTLAQRGLPIEPKYVAFYTADQADFAQLVGGGSNRLLGAALSRYTFTGDAVTTRSRAFYLNGAAFANARRQPTVDRQTTVTHELVHLALSRDSRPYTPPWLAEGMAEFYSGQSTPENRTRLLRGGQLDGLTLEELTKAESLGEHDVLGTQVGAQYAYSGETVAYLAKTFGEPKLLEFYRSYASVSAASVRDKMPRFGGSFAADAVFADLRVQLTASATQRYFNQSLSQLDTNAKAWVRQ